MNSSMNLDSLICPTCRIALSHHPATLRCPQCAVEYPVIDGIPIFVETDSFYESLYDVGAIKFLPSRTPVDRAILYLMSMHYLWYIDQYLQGPVKILDVACGGGTRFLTAKGEVVGIDLSLRLLQHLDQQHWYAKAVRASAMDVPYDSGTFDAVVAKFFFEHVASADKPELLAEFWRLLRPQGQLIMLFDCDCDNPFWRWAKRNNELFQKAFVENDGHYGLIRPSEALTLLSENGFRVIDYHAANKTPIVHLSMLQWLEVYRDVAWWVSPVAKLASLVSRYRLLTIFYSIMVTIWDDMVESFLPLDHARYLLVVCEKE